MKPLWRIFVACAACAAGWGLGVALPAAPLSSQTTAAVRPRDEPAEHPGPNIADVEKSMRGNPDRVAAAREWARRNPRAFFAWLLRTRPQPPEEVVEAFFDVWISQDVDAAFTAAHEVPARFGLRNSRFFYRKMIYLAETDARAAFRWVGRVDGWIGCGPSLRLAIEDKGNIDFSVVTPAEAAASLSAMPGSEISAKLARRYAEYLAAKDFTAARSWAETLNPIYRSAAMEAVLRQWMKSDRAAALAYLQNGPSQFRQDLVTMFFDGTSGTDPKADLEWLQQNIGVLPAGSVGNILGRWEQQDAAAALQYVLQTENLNTRTALLQTLTRNHFGDTRAAFQWVDNLPHEDRPVALGQLAPGAVLGDFPGFTEYLHGLSPDDGLVLIQQSKNGLNHLNPERAATLFQWFAALPAGSDGDRVFGEIVRLWKSNTFYPGTGAKTVAAMPHGPRRDLAEKIVNGK
ncbi:MAG TPA: hypothetical protein VG796_28985 [Verrucomicrobiales bacterium]|jgi:hypothetical protein|nr:hypothetical protein [Verrucomicrobiales bacterium]